MISGIRRNWIEVLRKIVRLILVLDVIKYVLGWIGVWGRYLFCIFEWNFGIYLRVLWLYFLGFSFFVNKLGRG